MNLSPLPIQKFFDNAGRPLDGGRLFTYVSGTTTKLATASDQAGTPNANPVPLNFRGEASVWLDPELTYTFALAPPGSDDPPTNPIWTQDDIAAPLGLSDLTQQIIGQVLYPRSSAEISAAVTVVNYGYRWGNVLRYGTPTGVSGADTAIVQAAINQAMETGGAAWYVPAGTICSVDTAGSVTSPVGNALLIDDACLGYIEGEIHTHRNCNTISITGDDVVILGAGRVKGWGTFYQTGADNGACIKNTGSRCRIRGLTIEDPPQYGIFYTSATAVGGKISDITILGGPTSFSATQHYGIEIEGPWRGLQIDLIQVLPNAAGTGRCVQGVASGTNSGIPTGVRVSNVYARQVWDHAIYWYGNSCPVSGISAYLTGGSGVKVIGGNALSSITSDECTGGGIDLCNFAGGSLAGFSVTNFKGIGISLEQLDAAADDSLSNCSISTGVVRGNSDTDAVRCGVRVQTSFSGTATNQKNIRIEGVQISNCTQAGSSATPEDEGAIQIQVGTAKTLQNLVLKDCSVDTCGWQGLEILGGGTLLDPDICDIRVRNPGTHTSAAGSDTHGFRVQSTTTVSNGSMSRLTARDDLGGSANMDVGFSNAGTVSGTLCLNNRSFGAVSAVGNFGASASYSSVRGSTASVADGGTITHGYPITPTSVSAQASVSREFVSVTAIGATTFTVAIKKDDGTAGTSQTIYWEVSA